MIIMTESFIIRVFMFPVDFFFLALLPLGVAPVLPALPLLLAAALLEGERSHQDGSDDRDHTRFALDLYRCFTSQGTSLSVPFATNGEKQFSVLPKGA